MQPRNARYALAALAVVAFALLGTGFVEAKTYWFEKYLRAVELIDSGQSEQAVQLLEELVAKNPVPSVAVRISGNQYIDYLPYYQTARAQAALGDLAAAGQSLEQSETCGALAKSRRRHARELNSLQQAIRPQGPPLLATIDP